MAQAMQLNISPFDQHLQEVGGQDQTPLKINWLSQQLHHIVNFEEDPGQMEQAYYWEDCMTVGGVRLLLILSLVETEWIL